ncbi:butyrophilin subfamily 1 member A1 isoform 2-T3 [Polymixia lowei]
MAPVWTCLFLAVIISICAGNASSFVKVECKSENHGQYGQQSMLDCVVKTSEEVENAEIRVVTWKKKGLDLVFFNRGEIKHEPRFQFAEPNWNNKNMNVSLLVTNTEIADIGSYECMVITDSGDGSTSTRLSVTARYKTPTIQSIPEKKNQPNTDVTLFCKSNGGYPKGHIRWFTEQNVEWKHISGQEAHETEDGLYSLTSNLTVMQDSVFPKYTCRVYSATGSEEGEATIDIPPQTGHIVGTGPGMTSKIVAPVVVIGSLIVGLLLLLIIKRRRSQSHHQPVVATNEDGEEGGDPSYDDANDA